MLDNRRLLVAVVILALMGVLALFAYSTTIKPVQVDLADIDESHVVKIITTSGTISYARALSDGSLSLELLNMSNSAAINVYVPSNVIDQLGMNMTPGTGLEITGEVLLYQDELEVSVASAQDMKVISVAGSMVYELGTIMGSIEMFDGMTIQTNGNALDIVTISSDGDLVGTSFVLYQKQGNVSYSLDCIMFDTDLSEVLEEWGPVNVTGQISYYANTGSWQLIVDNVEPMVINENHNL